MKIGTQAKAQSAFEFMTTYGWAILILVILVAGLMLFIYLPSTVIPQRCSYIYAITCEQVSVNTNAIATNVNLYLINGQSHDFVGPTIATASIPNYGYAGATCSPANIISGGIILCSIQMPSSIPVGQNVAGTLLINTSICLSGSLSNCQSLQPISYLGNFTASAGGALGSTNQIPVTVSISKAALPVSASKTAGVMSTIVLTAHVNIFGKPAKAAGVTFLINSDSAAGTSNTFSVMYALTNSTGAATTNLYVTGAGTSGNIIVNASFITFATNTISVS